MDNDSLHFGFHFFVNNRDIYTDKLYFKPVYDRDKITYHPSDGHGKRFASVRHALYADASDTAPDPSRNILNLFIPSKGIEYMLGFRIEFCPG